MLHVFGVFWGYFWEAGKVGSQWSRMRNVCFFFSGAIPFKKRYVYVCYQSRARAAIGERARRGMNLVPYLVGEIVPLEKDAIRFGRVLQMPISPDMRDK